MNVFLGSYFARGGKIDWHAFFENRLVRPFIPASKRIFIDNPCERSLDIPNDATDDNLPQHEDSSTADISMVADDTAGLFSKQQIDYIRRLINAEVKVMGVEPKEYAEQFNQGSAGHSACARLVSDKQSALSDLNDTMHNPDMLLQLASENNWIPNKYNITRSPPP